MTGKTSSLFGNATGESLRLPPSNPQAEQALLGGLFANNAGLMHVEDVLLAEHFADPVHARIYQAIVAMARDGRVADAVTLHAQFEHDGELESVGGGAYLASLIAAMVSPKMVPTYARVVRDLWVARQLISACGETIEEAYRPGEAGTAPVMEAHETALLRIAQGAGETAPTVSLGAAVGGALAAAERASRRADGLAGLSWGYDALDRMTGGLMADNVYVLGARPSMGKTALGWGITIRTAARGSRVLFWSGEMTPEQLGARAAAAHARVSTQSLFTARRYDVPADASGQALPLSTVQWDRLAAAERAAMSLPIEIDSRGRLTVAQLRARARRMLRSKAGLDLIVVDYIGLMQATPETRRHGRYESITEISADLLGLAKELGVPILVLAQLNRANEAREDKRPNLADLRDSGAIEQDAGFVMFLHREHYYLHRLGQPVRTAKESSEQHSARVTDWQTAYDASEGVAELLIAKNRHGPVGKTVLRFQDETTWFRDTHEHDEAPAWVLTQQAELAP